MNFRLGINIISCKNLAFQRIVFNKNPTSDFLNKNAFLCVVALDKYCLFTWQFLKFLQIIVIKYKSLRELLVAHSAEGQ